MAKQTTDKPLTVERTITIEVAAYKKKEPIVNPNGLKTHFFAIKVYTNFGLSLYREKMIEAAQNRDFAKFDECLAEYIRFKLLELAGVEATPIEVE